ncbi:MAG: hypothetical protein ACD_3C00086G0019 [uncultured bacterium (gcode 4)]|uniref:Uncharacterized protein n=1 Tax=uncultured bacterium (gcode 4) TaxID=1234023 RepID=K2GXN9_9BACT|nr:MAG: hypothetical protein ACD_3C00086G0019 [uncultured bacterium (gcode 4)]
MAWWKVFLDLNWDWILQENKESFTTTDKNWNYTFDNLEKWNYVIIEIPHQNWNQIKPKKKYDFYLNSWQNVLNFDLENIFIKWKQK